MQNPEHRSTRAFSAVDLRFLRDINYNFLLLLLAILFIISLILGLLVYPTGYYRVDRGAEVPEVLNFSPYPRRREFIDVIVKAVISPQLFYDL